MQAGWDWARETHDVTVTDERGHRVAHWTLGHREDELVSTMQRLAELEEPGDLPIAIETRSGLVVDRLLAAGHPVVPVHPNAFHALRPRWGASRAKSDAGDSYKLAEFLRTNLDADENTLRVLAPTLPETVHLRQLCRGRGSQFTARLVAADQLRALLDHHWPGPGHVFDRVDSPIALAFLARYPTPSSAQRVTPAVMARFLKRHGYSGKKEPAELVARLRRAPRPASTLPEDLLTGLVSAHIAQLQTSLELLRGLERLIASRVGIHPYAHVFAAMPRGRHPEPGPDRGRGGSDPGARRERRTGRSRGRSRASHLRLWQEAVGGLPGLGQPPRQASPDRLRRQQSPRRSLGRQPLCQCPLPRPPASPRDPHPGPRLGPDHVAVLAHQH